MAEDNGQGANSEPEQQSGGMLKDPQSRRRFLRAAAIGTAGVAGVAGLAGVAQATGAPKILRHAFGAPDSHISGGSSLEGFFEGTAPGTCTATYNSTNADGGTNRFITFYISNLPAGNGYSFNVTQDIGAGAVAIEANGSSSATQPWEFAQKNSSVHVVMDAAADHACPAGPSDDLNGSNSTPHNNYSFTFDVPSGTHNVAIYTHVDIADGVTIPDSTTFRGTLSGPVNLGPVSVTVTKA